MGNKTVCENETAPLITLTASSGMPPFSFVYSLNNIDSAIITTSANNNTFIVEVSTSTVGQFVYSLRRVTDANNCSETQSGNVTINVLDSSSCNSSINVKC